MDSNSRSKLWHDMHTNQQGKNLEELIITSDLFLMNEATDIPTFETIRGRSWIDLTLCSNILAQKTRRWMCGENERCSDHNLIWFDIEAGTTGCNAFDHTRKLYHIKTEDWGKFENKLVSNLLKGFACANISGDHTRKRYHIKTEDWGKFENKLVSNLLNLPVLLGSIWPETKFNST